MSNASFAAALAAVFETAINQAIDQALAPVRAELSELAGRINGTDELPEGWVEKIKALVDQAALPDRLPEAWAESIVGMAEKCAEEAVSEHESNHDHDDYDAHINDEEKHPDMDYLQDQMKDDLRDLVRNASLEISF